MWPFKPKPPVTETIIATRPYTTIYISDGKETEIKTTHIAAFVVNSLGERLTRVTSTNDADAKTHSGLLQDKMNWKYHGTIHGAMTRVVPKNNVAELKVIK